MLKEARVNPGLYFAVNMKGIVIEVIIEIRQEMQRGIYHVIQPVSDRIGLSLRVR